MEMKIEIISRENLKPSSPTPENLKYFNLSLLDQLTFIMSTPVVLFYSLDRTDHTMKEVSQRLKSSLSKALTLYYPIAGVVKDNSLIECNDNGVEYVEGLVNCKMSDVFKEPDNVAMEKLIPVELNSIDVYVGAIIQVNYFQCGGVAIGIGLSHKVGDATSLGTFIMAWAAMSLADIKSTKIPPEVLPFFVSDTIIPALKDLTILPPPPPTTTITTGLEIRKCITRRYVLDASSVKFLKAKAASASVQRPTRVEAVTALIWKCLMKVSMSKSGYARQSVLVHSVNLRKRFTPPLPQNYIGNLSGKLLAKTEKGNIEIKDLVIYLREGLEEVRERAAKGVQENEGTMAVVEFAKEFGDLHRRDDLDLYSFSSLCGFPLYDADFGWGKPAWVIVTNLELKNFVLLIDARDGEGIEVWLSLSEEDADLLERNEELLEFVTVNPSVDVPQQH